MNWKVRAPMVRTRPLFWALIIHIAVSAGLLSTELQADTAQPQVRVTVLGSGTPIPSRSQGSTAILVEAGGETLLFDCGRGCGLRLNQYRPDLFTKLDTVFLTHLHSDHVVGLPDLLLNGWSMGRPGPLRVWGPEGTDAMMQGLRQAYSADIGYRIGYTSEANPPALKQDVSIITSNAVVFNENDVQVTAFRVSHAQLPAFGYRIDYAGQSVLISGDTTVTPNLVKYGRGVNLALMEVLSPAMVESIQNRFEAKKANAIIGLHLTTDQAARTLKEMQPDLAVFYHTVANCRTDKKLLAKSRSIYGGPTRVARDLMQIDLSASGVVSRLPDATAQNCAP